MVTERTKYDNELRTWQMQKAHTKQKYDIDIAKEFITDEEGNKTRNMLYMAEPETPDSLRWRDQ